MIKHCIVNTNDRDITSKLTQLGFVCHGVIPSNRVSEPISCHSDVLYLKVSDNKDIVISGCQKENIPLLEQSGYRVTVIENLRAGYESESLLNYIINKKYVIYNPKTAMLFDEQVCGLHKITIKQGYTKCSVICVNETAYITQDVGVYNAIKKNKLNCLLMKSGNIKLDGYNYGFMGGSAIRLNKNQLLFCGDIADTQEKNKLIEFLKDCEVEAIFIKDKQLTDIGSALIL